MRYSLGYVFFILSIYALSTCKNSPQVNQKKIHALPADTIIVSTIKIDYDSLIWSEILAIENLVSLDLKYASDDNFTKQKIYNCDRCFLRPHVTDSLHAFAHHIKEKYNFSVLLFDCYRPKQFQQKLWDIIPDRRYVTPPEKGSMHNRGMAVDLTLVDSLGVALDMGTAFDHFDEDSFPDSKNIPKRAQQNRGLLRTEIEKFGFKGINSEWWHFSFRENIAPLSDWVWNCETD